MSGPGLFGGAIVEDDEDDGPLGRHAEPDDEVEQDDEESDAMSMTERVYEALKKAGNATAEELAKKLGISRTQCAASLRTLLAAKRVDRQGGHKGASWEVGTGKSTRGEGMPPPPRSSRAKPARKPRAVARGESKLRHDTGWLAVLQAERDRLASRLQRFDALLAEFAE